MTEPVHLSLSEIMKDVSSVAISGHIRPDGDCVGSTLGLALYLREAYPGIRVDVYLQPFPKHFLFIRGADRVIHTPPAADQKYDVFFILDCSGDDRLGENAVLRTMAGKVVCIDHHVTASSEADYNEIHPDASSASEIVCDLIGVEKISYDAAQALYTGMAHDTGVFRYSCTSSHTMQLAGALMDKGIPYSRIIEDTFYVKTYLQQQILGKALLESIRLLDGQVIFSAVKIRDLEFYEVTPADLDGIVSVLRDTEGVECAIFLYETGPQEWKVSLRSSEKVDVSQVAAYFGGGGHRRAAGCNLQGSVYDVVNNLMAHIAPMLEGSAQS